MDNSSYDLFVTPSKPFTAEIVPLPPADQWMYSIILPWILCFRYNIETSSSDTVSDLKNGLGRTIDEMPFLAGKLTDADPTSGRLQLEMKPDGGVALLIRHRPEIDYDDLVTRQLPPKDLNMSFLPLGFGSKVSDAAVQMQATFIKGGLVLGVSMNHTAMDAKGLSLFLGNWAQNVRAVSKARLGQTVEPTVKFPVEALDRKPFFGNDESGRLEDFLKFKATAATTNAVEPQAVELDFSVSALKKPTGSYWRFTDASLKALKEAATTPDQPGSWISTNDALCALLWSRMCIAKGWAGRLPTSSLTVPFDVRDLMSFHPQTVANAVTDVYLTSPTHDLASPDALRLTAGRVRRALKSVTRDQMRREWGIIGALEKMSDVKRRGGEAHVVVTSLTKQNWYSDDWGPGMGGKLDRLRIPLLPFPVTMILPHPEGGLEVLITEDEDVVDRLEVDEEFTRYATLLCR